MAALHDQIEAYLQERFVGREAQLGELVGALLAPGFKGLCVVSGPPGSGKSALLHAFARCCDELAVPCATIHWTETATAETLVQQAARQFGSTARTLEDLFAESGRRVLLLDGYRPGGPLDAALRAAHLNGSGDLLLVVAMREALPLEWLQDAEWSLLQRTIRLGPLADEAAASYLRKFGLAERHVQEIVEVACGHPLTLGLLAQRVRAEQGVLSAAAVLDVAEMLLHAVPGSSDPEALTALTAVALVGVASEPTLRTALAKSDTGPLFRTLLSHPITRVTQYGLAVCEPFATFLVESLAWRNAEMLLELRERLRASSIEALRHGTGTVRFPHLLRLLALADETGAYRRALVLALTDGLEVGVLHRDELEPALAFVPESLRELFRSWLVHRWGLSRGIRTSTGALLAWTTSVPLEHSVWETTIDHASLYDALARALHFRPGDYTLAHATWIAPAAPGSVHRVLALALAVHLERVIAVSAVRRSCFLTNLPEASSPPPYWELFGLRPIVCFDEGAALDIRCRAWNRQPVLDWLAHPVPCADNELAEPVLDRDRFAQAVARALRDFSRPERLRGNPLLTAGFIERKVGPGASEGQRIQVLRALLERAIRELGLRPQYRRWQAVAETAYLHPVESQERMAERLGIPFSTYRRYLKSATDWITDFLWQLEIGQSDSALLVAEPLQTAS
ncbi:ATP-binding protein [Thermomicrobium sp. 4228-Ro]|uniref:ATP-binding protein n=1 Tax=Thermomicrobium sp. 4228-Ro TaxID=2993937 RepID=UPI002248D838|nr:ATP-binding protein [Thermomicrobium sp. 4228-Ro]MCX2728240.1 ATP-binding protein [Thermomicrobium sp. 4228-Ro]